jgi:hypothetical protein
MGIIANCPKLRPDRQWSMAASTQRLVLVQDGPILKASTARFRDRILARLGALSLDHRLAAGEPPEASRLLAVRATRIGTPSSRRRLAEGWTRLLRLATRDSTILTTRVPLARSEIAAARSEIETLIELLTDERPVASRGLAMASRLLTEPGPVFRVGPQDKALAEAVAEVNQVLADD